MLSLHTNSAALAAQNSITTTQSSLATSQTRLSTGFRINSSQDDAAGLQIATRLKAQTAGMAVAKQNTQNSISMLQTADGSLSEVTNILSRMKDLATQAADASSTVKDQQAAQSEFDTLTNQLSNIVGNTSFGGTHLLNGTDGKLSTAAVTFQVGDSQAETMTMDLSGAGTTGSIADMITALGTATGNQFSADGTPESASTGQLAAVGGTSAAANQSTANTAIQGLNDAIDAVSAVRSSLGATENSLQHVFNNLQNTSTNTTDATGRIMDTDFATESSNMTSQQMLLQAGTAMLKQSNSISSLVISLLQ
jgi:flagellin